MKISCSGLPRWQATILNRPWARFLLLVATMLALTSSLLLLLHPHAPGALAASVRGQVSLCHKQPSREHCQNQDPMQTGCVLDAHSETATIRSAGHVLGLVERRHSPWCHTYWARITILVPAQVRVKVAKTNEFHGVVGGYSQQAPFTVYTDMVFVPARGRVPLVQGSLRVRPDPIGPAGFPFSATLGGAQ